MYYASFEEAFGAPFETKKIAPVKKPKQNSQLTKQNSQLTKQNSQQIETFSNDDSINVKIELMNQKIERILSLIEKYERNETKKCSNSNDFIDKCILFFIVVVLLVVGFLSYRLNGGNEKSPQTGGSMLYSPPNHQMMQPMYYYPYVMPTGMPPGMPPGMHPAMPAMPAMPEKIKK